MPNAIYYTNHASSRYARPQHRRHATASCPPPPFAPRRESARNACASAASRRRRAKGVAHKWCCSRRRQRRSPPKSETDTQLRAMSSGRAPRSAGRLRAHGYARPDAMAAGYAQMVVRQAAEAGPRDADGQRRAQQQEPLSPARYALYRNGMPHKTRKPAGN